MKKIFLIKILLSFSFLSFAQDGWVVYDTGNSNIPYDQVNCVTIANDGVKWVGTEYGVARFDEISWTTFRQANSDLPNDAIRSIEEGANGDIWVGTFLGGLAKFDGTNWTVYNTSNSGLGDNYIRSMVYDQTNGILWVGTTGGLHTYDGSNWTIYDSNNSSLLSNNISALTIDDSGVVWAGTINGGLAKVENGIITIYNKDNSGILDNTILDIAIDIDGNKWLATPSGGLNVLTSTGTWSIFLEINSGLISNSLSSVKFLDNCVFLGTQNVGLQEFGSWNAYSTSNSFIGDDIIKDITVEGDSVLWIASPTNGLSRFSTTCSVVSSNIEPSIESLVELSVYPNPVYQDCTVDIVTSNDEVINIELFDLQGKLISKKTAQIQAGIHQIDLSMGKLASGVFVLVININNDIIKKKLVKLK